MERDVRRDELLSFLRSETKVTEVQSIIGKNARGNALLLYVWGETDVPGAKLAISVDELKEFILHEYVNSEEAIEFTGLMKELEQHDWEEGEYVEHFEVGGIRIEDVYLGGPR